MDIYKPTYTIDFYVLLIFSAVHDPVHLTVGIQAAGIKWDGILTESYELSEQCVQTNYYGAKRMTEALIPLLQLSDSPRIANVSSSMGKLKVCNISNDHRNSALYETPFICLKIKYSGKLWECLITASFYVLQSFPHLVLDTHTVLPVQNMLNPFDPQIVR